MIKSLLPMNRSFPIFLIIIMTFCCGEVYSEEESNLENAKKARLLQDLPMGGNIEKNLSFASLLYERKMPELARSVLQDTLHACQKYTKEDLPYTHLLVARLLARHDKNIESCYYYRLYLTSEIESPEKPSILYEALELFGKDCSSEKLDFLLAVRESSAALANNNCGEIVSLHIGDHYKEIGDDAMAYYCYLQASSGFNEDVQAKVQSRLDTWTQPELSNLSKKLSLRIASKKKQTLTIYGATGIFVVVFWIVGFIVLRKYDIKRRLALAAKYRELGLHDESQESLERILKISPNNIAANKMIGKESVPQQTQTGKRSYNTISPVFKTLVSWMPFHYSVSWAILCQLLGFTAFLLLRYWEGDIRYVAYLISGGVGVYLCTAGLIWASEVIDTLKHNMEDIIDLDASLISRWFNHHARQLFKRNRLCSLGGVLIATVFVIAVYLAGGLWPESLHGKAVIATFTFTCSFLIGFFIFSLFPYIFMINEMADLPLLINKKSDKIMEIGRTSLKLSLLGVAVYTTYVIAVLMGLPSLGWPIKVLIGTMIWVLVAFFLVPQLKIHRLMVQNKQTKTEKLESQIDQIRKEFDSSPDMEKGQLLQHMKDNYLELEKLSEWPFNSQILLSFLGSVFLPLLFIILEKIL